MTWWNLVALVVIVASLRLARELVPTWRDRLAMMVIVWMAVLGGAVVGVWWTP